MAYATLDDIQDRIKNTLSSKDQSICENLLEDVAVMIDAVASGANAEAKKIVSCRAVIRATCSDSGFPIGATQGSQGALGYQQSWTVSGGSVGELYLSKADKRLLGVSDAIGAYSPIEEMVEATV